MSGVGNHGIGKIGIVGGGQLGAMMATEAKRMGLSVAVYCENREDPAAQSANLVCIGSLSSAPDLEAFSKACDVLTLEVETIPAGFLPADAWVSPSARALSIVQDRLSQRQFLAALGVPQPTFAPVTNLIELAAASAQVSAPAVLKTTRGGYDGRGQRRLRESADLTTGWHELGSSPCVVEKFIDFSKEISVVLARTRRGQFAYFPIAENVHVGGILHTSRVPAAISRVTERYARMVASKIARALEHVGVLTVEMFVLPDGRILVNEVALRVHNSGHFTLGGCVTSQFEQHVRAVCDLPLGDPTLLRPVVMLNLMGDLWNNGPPNLRECLSSPGVRLHVYGKTARAGRKMGHLLVLDADGDEALKRALVLHSNLQRAAGRQGPRRGLDPDSPAALPPPGRDAAS